MTVSELIEILQTKPGNAVVKVYDVTRGGYETLEDADIEYIGEHQSYTYTAVYIG